MLGLADRIAAEDTRNTGQLLARYGISKPLVAVHEHNEREAAQRVIELLRGGERVAYVSDAGTPGISDPGARLVDAVRAAGFAVVPLPGASAAVTALSVAGDWAGAFTFAGFLPPKAKQRATALQGLVSHPYALVFYEAPHRIAETVAALADAFGPAPAADRARLTKLHEQLFQGTLAEGQTWLAGDANRQRGEFVLVVEGAPATSGEADDTAHDALLAAAGRGAGEERGVLAAALTGASRNTLYARALVLKDES